MLNCTYAVGLWLLRHTFNKIFCNLMSRIVRYGANVAANRQPGVRRVCTYQRISSSRQLPTLSHMIPLVGLKRSHHQVNSFPTLPHTGAVCDFDQDHLCGFKSLSEGWSIQRASAVEDSTGLTTDHSTQTGSGNILTYLVVM